MIPEKILSRVKKLLELAQSDNINEANSALTKAHGLIWEYSIGEAELHKDDEKEITVDYEEVELAQYGYAWSRDLFMAVARAYHCQVIFINQVSKINWKKMNTGAHLFGANGDRETVKLMYDFAVQAKKRIAKAERRRVYLRFKTSGASLNVYLKNFNSGVVEGMRTTLYKIYDQNGQDKDNGGAYGLVLATTKQKTKLLKDKIHNPENLKAAGKDNNSGAIDEEALERGNKAGSGVGFNKQVSGETKGYLE